MSMQWTMTSDRQAAVQHERARGVQWRTLALLIPCYALLTAMWTGAGFLVKGPLGDAGLKSLDDRVARWFVERRTERLDSWSHWGSMLSDTYVKIGATALLAALFWFLWRRWLEPLLMASALIVEAAAFITTTWIVKRPRPDVPRLEESPVASSFPSGHVAASMAYGALAVIVWRHTRRRAARWGVVAVVLAITVIVGWARMYRGMHHLSDVIAGALLGVASVALTSFVLLRDEPALSADRSVTGRARQDELGGRVRRTA